MKIERDGGLLLEGPAVLLIRKLFELVELTGHN